MDNILFLFAIFMALELFEAYWQKADDIYGLIYNNYLVYKKSIFNFLLFNPTFFYVLFLIIYLDINSLLLYSIAGVKFVDLYFRITMVKRLDESHKMEEIIPVNVKMSIFYRYLNTIIYPITFLFALDVI